MGCVDTALCDLVQEQIDLQTVVNASLSSMESSIDTLTVDFGLFWILFQVLFLGLVIVFIGKWFWRSIW